MPAPCPWACYCASQTGKQLFYYTQFIDGFTGFVKSAGAEEENNPSFLHLIAFEVICIGKKLSKFQPVPFFTLRKQMLLNVTPEQVFNLRVQVTIR